MTYLCRDKDITKVEEAHIWDCEPFFYRSSGHVCVYSLYKNAGFVSILAIGSILFPPSAPELHQERRLIEKLL